MNTTVRRTKARRGEGSLLRDEILAAADALLIETASEEAVSIRAIGDRVGVSAPSIYRHFHDKDELMFAVCERTFADLDRAMEQAAVGHEDPFDALLARGRTYVEFGLAHPEHYRVMLMGSTKDSKDISFDGQHISGEVIHGSQAFNHLVDAAAAIVGRRRNPSATELAFEIWAFIHGVTSLRIIFPTMPFPPLDRQLTQFVDSLRARFARPRI